MRYAHALAATPSGEGVSWGALAPPLCNIRAFEHTAIDMSDCAICLDPIVHDDDTRTNLRCGHAYHTACIRAWVAIAPSCPSCRAPVIATSTILKLLDLARDSRLHGAKKTPALSRLFSDTSGSVYAAAVECARNSKRALAICDFDVMREQLAYMLVYLNVCGDARAPLAANDPTTVTATTIAFGLDGWSARAAASTAPGPARRCWRRFAHSYTRRASRDVISARLWEQETRA
jgi:Ring finger domain